MRIILSDTIEAAVKTTVKMVLEQIESHPDSVIGLATGRTMEPVYAQWVTEAKAGSLSFKQSFFFMLDEYLGLSEGHSLSFKSYIERHFLIPLSLSPDQFAFPPVHHHPIDKAGDDYEKTLRHRGGIDLQLLGIGQNGHFGFNEPGSNKFCRTRIVQLAPETREANRGSLNLAEVPHEALSMGIETILESKTLLMLATGKSKANAIKYLFNHHDDPACPATYLKSHPHFTLVLDPEAASKISLKI